MEIYLKSVKNSWNSQNIQMPVKTKTDTDRKITGFIEFSTEAGILLYQHYFKSTTTSHTHTQRWWSRGWAPVSKLV
jgi:hypothetical protein